eukprot:727427-Pyramimonas_sp.AAC.1
MPHLARSGCTCIREEACHPPANERTTIHRQDGDTRIKKVSNRNHRERKQRGVTHSVPLHEALVDGLMKLVGEAQESGSTKEAPLRMWPSTSLKSIIGIPAGVRRSS